MEITFLGSSQYLTIQFEILVFFYFYILVRFGLEACTQDEKRGNLGARVPIKSDTGTLIG